MARLRRPTWSRRSARAGSGWRVHFYNLEEELDRVAELIGDA